MPIFFVLIGLSVYGIAGAVNKAGTRKKAFTSAELDDILKRTTGMSKAESRAIIHRYK